MSVCVYVYCGLQSIGSPKYQLAPLLLAVLYLGCPPGLNDHVGGTEGAANIAFIAERAA